MFKRYTFDGYGETADGGPWTGGIGRPWPLLSGERGEVLGQGGDALPYLRTMANSANDGLMIPEQVWDQADPTVYNHCLGKGTDRPPRRPGRCRSTSGSPRASAPAGSSRPRTSWPTATQQAPPAAPQLTVTSPVDLSTATSRSVTVSGTTTAPTVYLSVNGVKQQIDVDRCFQRPDHAADGQQPDRRRRRRQERRHGAGGPDGHCLGARVGGIADPSGDDNGPGSYVYPTDGAFNPGSFDLTGFDVYRDGDSVRLVTSVRGAINNPGVATA